jgi:hypothetical protein
MTPRACHVPQHASYSPGEELDLDAYHLRPLATERTDLPSDGDEVVIDTTGPVPGVTNIRVEHVA